MVPAAVVAGSLIRGEDETMARIDRIWGRLIDGLFAIGAIYLLLIVAATIVDVVARNTFIHAPLWISVFVEYGLPIATMLAAPKLVRIRGHVAMELIDAALSERGRLNLLRVTDFAAASVSFLIAWYAAQTGYDMWQRGEIMFLAIDVPRWILFAVLSLGLLLCAIEFLRHILISFFARDDEETASV